MATILYLTQDGITDHIGQAQIAPYLIGLAELGHSIHIVSAEKPNRDALVGRYADRFEQAGMRWTRVPYANRPPLLASLWTMRLLEQAAIRIAKSEVPDIVHCRSYLPLGIASRLKERFGTRYLADFRDFWADVGMETKRFKVVFRWFLRQEPKVLGNADHVVALTERAAQVLIARHPHVVDGDCARFTVIPCCADFALFDRRRVHAAEIERVRSELRLNERQTVLVYLGSLGPDYLLGDMMRIFGELRQLRSDAVFLMLANNGRELVEAEAKRLDIPQDAIRFTSAAREEIPAYLTLADLSVVFIRPTLSKAGCSPTKLGELFAMGVPIVANSGFGDIDAILDPARNGSVVATSQTAPSFRSALETVLHSRLTPEEIRDASLEFSLDEGVRRYDAVYCAMMTSSASGARLRVAA